MRLWADTAVNCARSFEGRYMAERFADTYPGYKRSTKMLVPGVL
jgi:protein-S-isoprenylcysteine O-methyltransferase Ste14